MLRPSSTFSVKRWTLKITLCLIAGAVVTWAVAWGCALWGARPATYGEIARSAVQTNYGAPINMQDEILSYPVEHAPFRSDWGWPCRSLEGRDATIHERLEFHLRPSGSLINQVLHRLRPSERFGGELPIRILPFGFALDALLYGLMPLGVVEGVGLARRGRRIAKGRCPSCGYDRRGLAGDAVACPECGA